MSLLSLIMIVRNEAALLPEFLKHHDSLFDEMIIVDTGSSDGTTEIIEASRATLVNYPWDDHFSRARNAGIVQAKGQWLLLLDADERISADNFLTLRNFLEKAPTAVYLQKTINYFRGSRHLEWQPVSGLYPQEEVDQTGYFVAFRAGLFPNFKRLRFEGRVHESVLPSATEAGLGTYRLEIPVHHYGYVLNSEINLERQKRYKALVSLKVEENPEDWAALLEMASIFLESGEAEGTIPLLEKLIEGPDKHPGVNRGRFLLGRLKREKGDLSSARQLLLRSRSAAPDFLFAWVESIRLEAKLEAWSAVSNLLNESQAHFPAFEPLLMREKLMFLVKTGQIPEATTLASQLAERCPQWGEIKNLSEKLDKIKHTDRRG